MINWWRTDFSEADAAAVARAVRDRCLSQGRITREFEEKLAECLGVPYVVCTTSGTTALTMALMAAGIGPREEEVIVPNRTWIATAHAVMMTGAKVRLVDVDERGLLPRASFGWYPRGVIPVNLNGRIASMPLYPPDEDLPYLTIEDSCQAFPQPPRGLAACYSFSTAKLVPTGQGGAVATRDESLYRELKALRTHDVEDAMVPKVLTWRRFGYNFRYTDLQAALGLEQLAKLDEKIERLEAIRALYEWGLPDYLELLPCDAVALYTEVLAQYPENLRSYLLDHGIEARPFYPSLHTAPYLHATGEFPNSERFSRGLTLPSGPDQDLEDIRTVLRVLARYDFP